MIERTEDSGIITLRLVHGKASALDVELCEAIASAFAADRGARAIVLTGSGSIFSAGVDLVRLVDGGADYVRRFLPLLDRAILALLDFDGPLVAAVNGHAIAGGCILAAACDVRIMSRGKGRIGVPELLVGLPFPASAREVMQFVVPTGRQREVLLTGGTWVADQALERGLVDRVSDPETLIDDAQAAAGAMASIESTLFAQTKSTLLRELRERVRGGDPETILAAWTSPDALDRVEQYVNATVRKK